MSWAGIWSQAKNLCPHSLSLVTQPYEYYLVHDAVDFVFFAWTRLSMTIFAHYFNGALPTFAYVVINVFTFKQPTFLFIYFSAGAIFAAFIFSISVIAMPLMLDRNASVWTAAINSLRTCARNPVTISLWAFCSVVLVGFGLATNFLGLNKLHHQ